MECDSVIVRYAEIFLKSDYVRRSFTERLVSNISHALKSSGLEAKTHLKRHRIFLSSDRASDVAVRASKVFGVHSTSPAAEVGSDYGVLAGSVVEFAKPFLEGGGSFAVRVKKPGGGYPMSTMDLERQLGSLIQEEHGNGVDLSSPDALVGVEIHGDAAYLYTRLFDGVGGLPYGSQGLLAAEVRSPRDALAAWMMMRRGCKMLVAGDREYAGRLSYYSNPDVECIGSLDDALASGVHGVVSSDNLGSLADRPCSGVSLPVYMPLIGLDDAQIGRLMDLSGL
ncbi:MAG: hypothetical protein GF416_05140 [Candidatus Altiarchaeales archaeon]|nr:hypothetical protein [Candidatus Altiarchaeales archaeon]MBD3416501.1 hypothetical protein [Candidatus Altiarchaeales archaeon]